MPIVIDVKKRLGRVGMRPFDLDVKFESGDGITILSGASGAGKTTTLRLIAGILTPDAGRIEIGGRLYFDSANRSDIPIQERRVGYVFQDYALFPHLTAIRNVEYGIRLSDKNARRKKASEMLELFRISAVAERVPRDISGGEQQRVALARALASDPEILLLDEPLSAVDVETRISLLDEIEAVQRTTGIPVLYVTHNEAEGERLGMHRVVLDHGRVQTKK